MKINLETGNKNFGEIIGNGKRYFVPKYQRNYSWDYEQFEDLWDDLQMMYDTPEESREKHYMGYLVLQEIKDNQFKIIDGQQRITTLSLMILAVLQVLKKQDNKEHLELIKRNFIVSQRLGDLVEEYKLTLNKNNDEYYRNELVSLNEKPKERGLNASEHLLRKAKTFFQEKLENKKLSKNELGEFINTLSNGLLFTVITVGDDVNAYKIFETLNARGVELSTPDLLKNYLFSVCDEYEHAESLINNLEEKWNKITFILGHFDFTKFIRTQWNSSHKFSTKTTLFKNIRNQIKEPQEAKNYIEALYKDVDIYVALQNAQDLLWNGYSSEVKECIQMLKIFNIIQPLGALLRAYEKYDKKAFEKFCKYILAFCVRYNAICTLPPNQQEKFYNKLSQDIANGIALKQVKIMLKDLYVVDEQFENAFAYKEIATTQSSKKAIYLLWALENHINRDNPISMDNYTLEHILPKKEPKDDTYWSEQFGNSMQQNIERLGNLTLLEKKKNEKIGNSSFQEKKAIFQKSSLKILQKICEYEAWNPENISDYQHWLAENAVKKWRIEF